MTDGYEQQNSGNEKPHNSLALAGFSEAKEAIYCSYSSSVTTELMDADMKRDFLMVSNVLHCFFCQEIFVYELCIYVLFRIEQLCNTNNHLEIPFIKM